MTKRLNKHEVESGEKGGCLRGTLTTSNVLTRCMPITRGEAVMLWLGRTMSSLKTKLVGEIFLASSGDGDDILSLLLRARCVGDWRNFQRTLIERLKSVTPQDRDYRSGFWSWVSIVLAFHCVRGLTLGCTSICPILIHQNMQVSWLESLLTTEVLDTNSALYRI